MYRSIIEVQAGCHSRKWHLCARWLEGGQKIVKSNQIIFIGVRSSKDYYKRLGGVAGVYRKGHLGVSFLCGSMCAEGMGCERRWVRWILRGTWTASGHPGVP